MAFTDDIEDRAERLGATMLMLGLVREPAWNAMEGANEAGLLTVEQWDAWREADAEDLNLALACLNAEFELRAWQWEALEFLLHVRSAPEVTATGEPPAEGSATGGEHAGEAMVMLPRAHVVAVAEVALGWYLPPPEEATP